MTIQQKLDAIAAKNNSLVSIGLDSDISKIPLHLQQNPDAQFLFNKAIINATHDLVCAYKPNSAFYEGAGAKGIEQLKRTCDYIQHTYPDIPIIIDAKRADIGNTNVGYADYVFTYLGADAVTLQPFLGGEALKPFLDRKDKGVIILCRTSNPGAHEFQDLLIEQKPLYQIVAERVANSWNKNDNCMLVVGATYPEELKIVRTIARDMTFLVPGIGAQGGNVEQTMKAGMNSKKSGLIMNAGRSIIFASNGEDFDQKAREVAIALRDEINSFRI
jgi:orotidine-5'-phosphate decarboxylase